MTGHAVLARPRSTARGRARARRDRGFKFGDAVFDTTRTFGHRVFKLREHVDRLYRSLRYLQIDPGLPPARMIAITEEVLGRNLPLLEPDEDYWVTQGVSRGLEPADQPVFGQTGPTVIVGARRHRPTPRGQFVLGGISRETVIDLCRENGIPLVKADLDLCDACGAEEAFLTSTSLCICPVRSLNGVAVGGSRVPGPIRRLTDAYARLVDCDFVAQYLKRLG